MRKNLTSFMALLLIASAASAQDESIETFNAIRLEHSSNPGQTVTLSAPTGISQSYSLIWPSTPPSNTTQRWAFSLNGSNNNLSWYATPLGAAGQVAYFSGTESIVSGSSLTWSQTNQTLGITNTTGGQPALRISKTVSGLSATDTMLVLSGTFSSSAGQHLAMMQIIGNGTSAGSGTRLTGLRVNVSGADTNRAAIFNGGNVGINTDFPKVYLDVAGDFAAREYNYTGNLGSVNSNVNFDNIGNRMSFVRIGTTLSGSVSITGFAGGYSGKILNVYNATGYPITILHNTGNPESSRIKSGANANLLLLPGNVYQFIYSATDQRWIVAFSGPGELSNLGNKEVTLSGQNEVLPSSLASYIQVNTPNVNNVNNYDITLADGTTPGQILVVQNLGPKQISFIGTNVVMDNSGSDLQDNESSIFVWNGTKWVQVARASN